MERVRERDRESKWCYKASLLYTNSNANSSLQRITVVGTERQRERGERFRENAGGVERDREERVNHNPQRDGISGEAGIQRAMEVLYPGYKLPQYMKISESSLDPMCFDGRVCINYWVIMAYYALISSCLVNCIMYGVCPKAWCKRTIASII